jgi:hypothetical protein
MMKSGLEMTRENDIDEFRESKPGNDVCTCGARYRIVIQARGGLEGVCTANVIKVAKNFVPLMTIEDPIH